MPDHTDAHRFRPQSGGGGQSAPSSRSRASSSGRTRWSGGCSSACSPAAVVGSDEQNDIAVLRTSARDLPPADIGQSSRPQIGRPVIAVGSPLGLTGTVTAGIVSAVDRDGSQRSRPVGVIPAPLVELVEPTVLPGAGGRGGLVRAGDERFAQGASASGAIGLHLAGDPVVEGGPARVSIDRIAYRTEQRSAVSTSSDTRSG